MTNAMNTGDNRSLVLLGALAALALNRDLRRSLVSGTQNAWEGAHHALDETVKPALGTAAAQAQELAQGAARRGADTLGTLREEAPGRAQTLLHTALGAAGHLAEAVQQQAAHLADDAGQMTEERRHQAQLALKAGRRGAQHSLGQVRDTGMGLLAGVQDKVHDLLSEAGDDLEVRRRQAEKRMAAARREAERELRRGRQHWKTAKLEKAVNKHVAPLQKQLHQDLLKLERDRSRQRRAQSKGGLGGTFTTLALLGTGAVVLARVPAVRRSILSAVESVNPDAAQSLRKASRNARDLIGSAWLESIEEPKQTPAPGVAAKTQGGTTGGTWGASPAPDSPSAAKTQAEQAAPTPESGKAADGSPKVDSSKNN